MFAGIEYGSHVYGVIENVLLDVYRVNTLMRPSDVVLDLGAGIGDFTVMAARRARRVIAVEPNPSDFAILLRNIEMNGVGDKVVALNVGVGASKGRDTLTFRNQTFSFDVDTLSHILQGEKVDFVKMDIEGYEVDVIRDSLEMMQSARVVAIELHNTKKEIDLMLSGFTFLPLTKSHFYMRLLRHPLLAWQAYRLMRARGKAIGTPQIMKGELQVGAYVREIDRLSPDALISNHLL